jgi:hypothetical protein
MPKSDGFTLRLVLEGICTWVPDSPFFEQLDGKPVPGNPTSLTILLREKRATKLADWEERSPYWPVKTAPCLSPPHAPVLILSKRDMHDWTDTFSIDGKFTALTGPPPHSRVVHVLDYQELSLGDFQWPPLTFECQIPCPHDAEKPTMGVDDRSLWWLPRMSEISPLHQWCDAALLKAPLREFKKRKIAARLHLPGGHLSVAGFNSAGEYYWVFGKVTRDKEGKLYPPPKSDWVWKKAIGNVLHCDIPIRGSEVRLNLKDSSTRSHVTLRPRQRGGRVEVTIANAELENVVLNLDSEVVWADPVLPDVDFQAHYPFTTGPGDTPWAVPFERLPDDHGAVLKPCSGAALSGSR